MHKGHKHSDATKQKMRNAKARLVSTGWHSWNKGKPWSAESKAKMRLAKLGIPQSSESNKKRSLALRGSKSYRWRGGVSTEHERLRGTMEFRQWKVSVFRRDNRTCVLCGYHGSSIEADHIMPFAYFPDLRLEIFNGRTLCKKCHKSTDTYGVGATKLYGNI
jgi:5-methylcytosine-specific restriction endonuclease McrA